MIKARDTQDGRRYDVRLRDPAGRVYTRTFRTRKKAEEFQARELADRSRGQWIDPRGAELTVEAVSKKWLRSNPSKRPTTFATDEVMLRVHVIPALGKRRIGSIKPPDVQELVNAWSKSAAPRTVRRRYGVLKAVMNYAVEADWLGRSPCRGIKLPPLADAKRRVVSPDDVAAIAAHTPDEYRPMVWLGALLGLRWSEVAALRVSSLDIFGRRLTVAEALTRDRKGRPVFGPPKSSAGARTLAIAEALARILAEHLARRDLTAVDGDQLLFVAADGGPVLYSNWRSRIWQPATKAASLTGVGFHDLRRTAATALVLEGVDVRTAQARLGHSDPRLTLGLYAQVVEQADRDAAEAVGARFFASGARDGRAMDGPAEEGRKPAHPA